MMYFTAQCLHPKPCTVKEIILMGTVTADIDDLRQGQPNNHSRTLKLIVLFSHPIY